MVGMPTVEAIVGNKIAPGLLDAYLARTCYDAQMTAEPEDPGRADNLCKPVDGRFDYGAHGTFDDRARTTSWQLWANMNRGWLALGAGGIAAIAWAMFRASKSRSDWGKPANLRRLPAGEPAGDFGIRFAKRTDAHCSGAKGARDNSRSTYARTHSEEKAKLTQAR